MAGFVLAAALLASLILNLLTPREVAGVFRTNGAIDRAELTAVESSGSVRTRPAEKTLSFVLPRGGVTIGVAQRAPVGLRLRHFTDPAGLSIGGVPGGTSATLRIPPDTSARLWRPTISPVQAVRLCGTA